jgi:hypothetical protein
MVMTRILVLAAALLVAGVGTARAEAQCTGRPAVGGGAVTSCREVGSAVPPVQYRTRAAVGGGTITTGGGRTCITRPATGGGTATTCRETP